MTVGFSSSARYAEHVTGPHHPERPDRLRAIHRAVREAGLVASADPFQDFRIDLGGFAAARERLVELPEPVAAAVEHLLLVHPAEHVERIRRVCEAGGGVLDHQGDTPVGPNAYEIARLGLGGLLSCCDAVMAGSVRRAFNAA